MYLTKMPKILDITILSDKGMSFKEINKILNKVENLWKPQ